MSVYKLVVMTTPVEGREDDYNQWYQGIHIPQVLTIPGMQGAQRFKATRSLNDRKPYPYLAIFDIETDNIAGVFAEMGRRAQANEITRCDAVDPNSYVVTYEALGPRTQARS